MNDQGFSADDIFGASTTSNTQKETSFIVPPTEEVGNITKITGLVKGVAISGYKYKPEQGTLMLIIKELGTDNVHFHFMDDPENKEYYQQFEGEEKAKKIRGWFKEITSYCQNFDYPSNLKAVLGTEKHSFVNYASKLLDHVIALDYNKGDVTLKLTFKEPSGAEKKFISKRFCIGKEPYIDFQRDGEYAEILEFENINKQPDQFTSPSNTAIDDIFSPSTSSKPVTALL